MADTHMNHTSDNSTLRVPWGDSALESPMPANWRLLGTMIPSTIEPLADPERMLDGALRTPTGCPALTAMAHGKKRVAIVVDDISRPTPAHRLMGSILAHLRDAGVRDDAITFVPGLGLHRPMTAEEMEAKVGKNNLAGLRWHNPDCRDKRKLTYLGTTKRRTRAYVDKAVAGADLVVLVGTIEPHPHAGFGGGFKNVLPGVAGVETIANNHAICAHPKYFSMIGTDPDTNPMRQDIEEAGRMLRGDTFLVNTVLNSDIEIVRLVAGDPVAAHREGVGTAAQVFGAKIPSQADVLITNSCPMDIDLRQGVKAVANTLFAVKPGGVVLACLKCDEGMGNIKIHGVKLPYVPPGVSKIILELLATIISKFAPPGVSPEERFSVYFMLKALLRNKLFLCAPAIADSIDGISPSIRVFRDFPAAVGAVSKAAPRADVLVFPQGGITYPVQPSTAPQ